MVDIDELAVSLHCKLYPKKRPGYTYDTRTNKWLKNDDIETMIHIYEDRVQGWFLDYGTKLAKDHNAGFVVLQLAVSYLESNQQFREGGSSRGSSKDTFVRSMSRLFGNQCSQKDMLVFYEGVRCGLFHDWFTKQSVLVSNSYPDALRVHKGTVLVNPNLFFQTVQEDFGKYISELKDPGNTELRDNFEKRFICQP